MNLYGWAFSAFWLTNIIGITLAGSDADRRGPGRALAVGVVLFAAGMVVSGLASAMPMVIVGRAIQGFGSGALGSVIYAAIARAYPASTTPRMIALTSSAWVIPGLIGPALAGWVTDSLDWRWVFLGIVPPVLLMGLAVYPQLARLGRAAAHRHTDAAAMRAAPSTRCAWRSGRRCILAALTIGSLPLALLLGISGGWLAIGALRHLLPPGTLRLRRGRPAVVAVVFAIAFAFFGTEAFVPLTVVEVRGGSVTLGGLALSAAAVTWTAGSWVQARAAAAGIRRTLVTSGAGLIGAGIVITALVLVPRIPIPVAGVRLGGRRPRDGARLLDAGAHGPRDGRARRRGFSSSALQLMFTLGTAFGAGVGGAVVAVADAGTIPLASAIGIVDAVMLGMAVVAVAVSLRVPFGPSARSTVIEVPGSRGALPLEHP